MYTVTLVENYTALRRVHTLNTKSPGMSSAKAPDQASHLTPGSAKLECPIHSYTVDYITPGSTRLKCPIHSYTVDDITPGSARLKCPIHSYTVDDIAPGSARLKCPIWSLHRFVAVWCESS